MFRGTLRTAVLVLSPRRLPVTLKNVALWQRMRRIPDARDTWDRLFDPAAYVRLYADVAESGIDPAIHYLLRANEEYRDLSDEFDTRYYLKQYPEVALSRVNALLHYALFGKSEGRLISRPPTMHGNSGDAPAVFINNDWRRDYPLVSVVIPCFNYGRYVEEAVRSVLNQTFPDFEVIVVEGGSTDSETVREVRRLESLGLPKVRFYYRSERHFAGDNRNFGIGLARGRYICCLDADDMLSPTYLEIAAFLAEVFGNDLICPSLQCFGDSTSRWIVFDPSFPEILTDNSVSTVALFRRAAWAHVGGFRDFGIGPDYVYEDWDFWIRLVGHGFRATSIREPLHLYRVHGAGITATHRPDIDWQRERLRTVNSSLLGSSKPGISAQRSVLNAYANLASLDSGPPGFLLALPFLAIGGAEKLFRTIGEAIALWGERLVVITSLTLPEMVSDDNSCFDNITPHVYHLPKLFRAEEERQEFVRYLIRRYRVHTILLAGCELLYHMLPELAQEFPDVAVIDQLFNDSVHVSNNRRYSKHIHATVIPSQQLLQSLTGKHNTDHASIHVIPHGILAPDQNRRGEDCGLPAASQGKTIVGFFGRLSPEKGADLFVEIARGLQSGGEFFFIMTGEGPERKKVLDQIHRYGLASGIYAPGFVPDVFPLMRATDIVVLPSRLDGMPLAVLEAQALGKTVVASRVGSLPEMISDAETGFLCDPGDIAGFRDRILRLARDPALRNRIGAAARESVLANYGAQRMLEAYERVFRSIRRELRSAGNAVGSQ